MCDSRCEGICILSVKDIQYFLFVTPAGSGFCSAFDNSLVESSFCNSVGEEISSILESSGSMGMFWCGSKTTIFAVNKLETQFSAKGSKL